jgi:hypothetical protein
MHGRSIVRDWHRAQSQTNLDGLSQVETVNLEHRGRLAEELESAASVRRLVAIMAQLFLQLPRDVEAEILLRFSSLRSTSLKELNILRLVNKDWRTAVEEGRFGRLGKLLKPGVPRLAVLFRRHSVSRCGPYCMIREENYDLGEGPAECRSDPKAYLALGLLDEEAGEIRMVPLDLPGIPFQRRESMNFLLHGTTVCSCDAGSKASWDNPPGRSGKQTLQSIDLCCPRTDWQQRGSLDCSLLKGQPHEFRVLNGVAMDEPHWNVYLGYNPNLDGCGAHQVLAYDIPNDSWLELPLSSGSQAATWCGSGNLCFISQGRIWAVFGNPGRLLCCNAAVNDWQVKDARAFRTDINRLDELPERFEVLATSRVSSYGGLSIAFLSIAIEASWEPRILDLKVPIERGRVRAALSTQNQMLVLYGTKAYLGDRRRLTYTWEQEGGLMSCSVLWAATLPSNKQS